MATGPGWTRRLLYSSSCHCSCSCSRSSAPVNTVLYYAVLYYTILYKSTYLYCTVLCKSTLLYCVKVLYCNVLYESTDLYLFQILRISQLTGQMRLTCRRRSVSPSEAEDVLNTSGGEEEGQDEEAEQNMLRERQCARRMAVVLD